MDISNLQAINLSVFPVDLILVAMTLFCAYGALKRGLFREFMILIVNVPYVAIMFYLFNAVIQNEISFDSFLYKASALGGFYIAYLIGIWLVAKSLSIGTAVLAGASLYINKILVIFISFFRTFYFIFACLVFFNLHINQPEMLEKSEILSSMNPYAIKAQNYLLKNGILKNEITLYEDAVNGRFSDDGEFIHPFMDKIKDSDTFKDVEKNMDMEKIRRQIENELKGKL